MDTTEKTYAQFKADLARPAYNMHYTAPEAIYYRWAGEVIPILIEYDDSEDLEVRAALTELKQIILLGKKYAWVDWLIEHADEQNSQA